MGTELFFINVTASLFILFFSFLVWRAGLKPELNRNFFYFLLALFSWVVTNYLSNQTVVGHEALLIINRLLFVGAILAVAFMFRFCSTIRTEVQPLWVKRAFWGSLALAIILSLSPYVVEDITEQGVVVGIIFGWGAAVYFAILAGFALGVIFKLFIDMVRARGVVRARARALFSAFALGLGLVAVSNVVLPVFFDSYYLSALGSLVVVVMLSGVGYSIVKYKLFDIRLFIARSLAYVFVIVALTVIYSIVTFGVLSRLTGQQVVMSHELPYLVVAVFLGLTFQSMKRFFDRISYRIFYKDRYDTQDVLNQFGSLILGEVRLGYLLDGTLALLAGAIKPEYGAILLVNDQGKVTKSVGSTNPDTEDRLARMLELTQKTGRDILYIDGEDLTAYKKDKALHAALKAMQDSETQVVVRLKTSSAAIGYIVLGYKRSAGLYTDQDIRLLTLIGGELAVALENSLRFEEIRNFNKTLQQKVDDATQRLRHTNSKLRQLDATKDEFVSMASHQLRTPLTSVKGYLSMVLEGDAGKLNPAQEKLLKEAYSSSERMVRLISDFLNVSRLRTGKFMIERSLVNLADVIDGEINQLEATAATRELKLDFNKPAEFPEIYIDKSKIEQVIMNFIDNAIFYSHPGGIITIELTTRSGDVVFKVRDQGIGVPPDEKRHLFTKFFRASNARRQRPDGTGIGLFMAQKVVIAHNGSIIFESTEGKGSTFGFRIPMKQPEGDVSKRLG